MYSHVYRVSHKTYTNWECGSLEGRPHFSPFIWFDFWQILKAKAKTKNALINSSTSVILTYSQDWHSVLIQLSAQDGVVVMCKTLACHKGAPTLGMQTYHNHREQRGALPGGEDGRVVKRLSSEPAVAKVGHCCSLSVRQGLKRM